MRISRQNKILELVSDYEIETQGKLASMLRAEGYEAEALRVADGLVRAADAFDYQIPELYSGDSGENSPSPYPAACHPQAWSAASSVSVLSLLLGLEPCSTEPTPSESPLARGLRLNRN